MKDGLADFTQMGVWINPKKLPYWWDWERASCPLSVTDEHTPNPSDGGE